MNFKKTKWIIAAWIVLMILLTAFMLMFVRDDTKNQLGKSMSLLAMEIAQNLKLSNEDVSILKQISYDVLVDYPQNKAFEERARHLMAIDDIKYIYLEVVLPAGKYQVEPDEVEVYDSKVGSNLSLMYLLDAVPRDEERFLDEGTRPFDDKSRYNVLDLETKKRHLEKRVTFSSNADKWGRYISGFAPVYSEEGDYIGLLGVDLNIKSYENKVIRYSFFIMGFMVINALGIVYVLGIFVNQKKMYALNNLDALTQIYNRVKIWDVLVEKWYEAKKDQTPMAVLLVDIDYFKEYNDYYGHLAGNEVLKTLASELKSFLEGVGAEVGRYGGDRFMCVVPGLLPEEVRVLGEQLTEHVHELNLEHKESSFSECITVSIGGVVTVPHLHVTPEEAFDLSSNVLYEVKSSGRGKSRIKVLH